MVDLVDRAPSYAVRRRHVTCSRASRRSPPRRQRTGLRGPATAGSRYTDCRLVLVVADILQPIDVLAVERFLHGDVNHDGCRAGAVPMLLVRRNPDHVAGANFPRLAAPHLHPADPGRDAQRLAEGMSVPMGPRPRLETHQARADARRGWRLDDRVLPDGAGERVGRPPARRSGATGV